MPSIILHIVLNVYFQVLYSFTVDMKFNFRLIWQFCFEASSASSSSSFIRQSAKLKKRRRRRGFQLNFVRGRPQQQQTKNPSEAASSSRIEKVGKVGPLRLWSDSNHWDQFGPDLPARADRPRDHRARPARRDSKKVPK